VLSTALVSREVRIRVEPEVTAAETLFAESAVLSALPRPTIDFVIPTTVPVKVGLAVFALVPTVVVRLPRFVTVVSRLSLIDLKLPSISGFVRGALLAVVAVGATGVVVLPLNFTNAMVFP
jgi:hypothetical protein